MRQIVLDTETTGLDWRNGDRVIEIGCVELLDRGLTGRHYHVYINPGRGIDAEAVAVHGITEEFLADKPKFSDIVADFEDFVRDAELVIHNASFDVGFLNMELERLGPAWGRTEDYCTVFDTLPLAREMHPGQRNSLDALCKRYDVSNAHRERHGALLDAELLAEVYLAMTGGQATLALDAGRRQERHPGAQARPLQRPSSLVVVMPSAEELAAHEQALKAVDKASRGQCVWMKS